MTDERLIPLHAELCKIEGVTNIELGESLTFEKNGLKWSVQYIKSKALFALHLNGQPVIGFTRPEAIKEFFSK